VNLQSILKKYREQIINEWIDHLHSGVSERYKKRPLDELVITVTAAYDASCSVLLKNDFSKIACHIEWITKSRLQGGFSLSEVQNAYELFRVFLMPVLTNNLEGAQLSKAIDKLNQCLFYTVTRYSDYFQALHEKEIRDHAENLEQEVENRTKELAESEAKYRVLIEEINDGYFVNQNGNIIFANMAFCDIHGYKPGKLSVDHILTSLQLNPGRRSRDYMRIELPMKDRRRTYTRITGYIKMVQIFLQRTR